MNKMPKENKQLRQIGEKIRSERLVSSYIRGIGNEKTEIYTPDSSQTDSPQPELISKAEMLARDIWKEALEGTDKKLRLEYRKLVLDRIEGRAGIGIEEQKERRPIPKQISERGKERLKQIADSVVDEGDDKFKTY